MDTAKPMWEVLLSIPIGTIVGWLTVVFVIGAGICTATIQVYKAFEKYKSLKEKNVKLEETVTGHDTVLKEVVRELKAINDKLDSQDITTMKKLRRELVKDGERYLVEKKMTIREWKSWMEMYEEYTVKFKQNSYVQTLKQKIEQSVEIIGKLDEHGNDLI